MAVTHKYVDFADGDDGNSGDTDADAYKTIQVAINGIVDGGAGNQINIKSNAVHVLTVAINWSTGYSPTNSYNNPLMIRGYTSVVNDGGIGEIDGNSVASSIFVSAFHPDHVLFIDLKLHNTTASLIFPKFRCALYRCELFNSGGTAMVSGTSGLLDIVQCHFHTPGTSLVYLQAGGRSFVYDSFFDRHDGTGLQPTNDGSVFLNNLFVNGTATCMLVTNPLLKIIGNTFVGSGAISKEGLILSSGADRVILLNNIFTDFSGAGSSGFTINATAHLGIEGHNLFFNNETDRDPGGELFGLDLTDNDKFLDPGYVNPAGDNYAISGSAKEGGYPLTIPGSSTSTFFDIGVAQRREGPSGLVIGE